MIFVTTGAQMPFDRLVRAVDGWAGGTGREAFAQIGDAGYEPRHLEWTRFLPPAEFRARLDQASAVVAHAGMGTIIRCLELGKPILVMPRRASLGETRNDHQVATAKRFRALGMVRVANDEGELLSHLDEIERQRSNGRIGRAEEATLTRSLGRLLSPEGRETPPEADGIVCFGGEDWWYHNRGHYDMRMMRELSRATNVLYVNSIGMRNPSLREGAVFLRRVGRKLRSLSRTLSSVDEGFHVLTALTAPLLRRSEAGNRFLAMQVRSAARAVGIHRPVVWVACPPAAAALRWLDPVRIVYQRTDRYECFPGVDAETIRRADRELKERADPTLFCSRELYREEAGQCRRAVLVDHGVDYESFARAARRDAEPEDVREIPRPRVGFVGGIDAHTFDPALFLEVADRLPDVSFVLVGGCSLPEDWCGRENVHELGRRPLESVPSYMAACDVLIMPWRKNEWIRFCNPVKLKEYLAVGRPVVSTAFPELERYGSLVSVARGPEEFAFAIRNRLAHRANPRPGREAVRNRTWRDQARRALGEIGPVGRRSPRRVR